MKIQCDVCGKEAASVFCTADEAALCQNCDNRVHNANKLASKHPRFSLLNPQSEESPRGVKLSTDASSFQSVTSSSRSQSEAEIKVTVANEVNNQQNSVSNCSESSLAGMLRTSWILLPIKDFVRFMIIQMKTSKKLKISASKDYPNSKSKSRKVKDNNLRHI